MVIIYTIFHVCHVASTSEKDDNSAALNLFSVSVYRLVVILPFPLSFNILARCVGVWNQFVIISSMCCKVLLKQTSI